MQKNKLLLALVITSSVSAALADDEINWSGGVKVWNATANLSNDPGTKTYQSAEVAGSILSITGKKDDYFVTFSSLMPTSYSVDYNSTTSGLMKRRDIDVALGWHFHENFSALIGQKYLMYKSDGSPGGYLIGTYVGLSSSKMISEKSFLYGTATTTLSVKASADNTATGDNFKITNYDFGYGYVLNSSTQLTLGYKSQYISRRYTPSGNTINDPIRGLIFGANFNFN
jgi:hypothetical protein